MLQVTEIGTAERYWLRRAAMPADAEQQSSFGNKSFSICIGKSWRALKAQGLELSLRVVVVEEA